jgi:hypothetical protein
MPDSTRRRGAGGAPAPSDDPRQLARAAQACGHSRASRWPSVACCTRSSRATFPFERQRERVAVERGRAHPRPPAARQANAQAPAQIGFPGNVEPDRAGAQVEGVRCAPPDSAAPRPNEAGRHRQRVSPHLAQLRARLLDAAPRPQDPDWPQAPAPHRAQLGACIITRAAGPDVARGTGMLHCDGGDGCGAAADCGASRRACTAPAVGGAIGYWSGHHSPALYRTGSNSPA